jgi:hypothetical protein
VEIRRNTNSEEEPLQRSTNNESSNNSISTENNGSNKNSNLIKHSQHNLSHANMPNIKINKDKNNENKLPYAEMHT